MGAKAKGLSTKEAAKKNARRLQDWIESTPVQDIPRNQFGRAAVTPILEEILGIPSSTRNSNKAIKEAFKALDALLLKHGDTGNASEKEPVVQASASQLAELRRELLRLTTMVSRLEYLENTGRTLL
jgi:hypothetical protein